MTDYPMDIITYDQVDKWIEAAVLAEREACAKVCDDKHDYMCSRAAAAIRSRGEK